MKKIVSIFKIVLTIGILCFVFYRIEWNRVAALLTTISIPYVIMALVLIIAGTLISALAELQIMRAIHLNLTYWKILKTNYSSFFYSIVHEFVGAVVRYRRFSGDSNRRGEAVFVMGYEKIQMLLVLYIFSLFSYLLQTELYLEVIEKKVLHLFYLLLGTLFLVIIMLLFIRPLGETVEKALQNIKKKSVLIKIAEKCLDLVRIVKQLQARPVRYLAAFVLYSAGIGLGVFVYFFLFKSLHLTLTPVALVWTVSFATLAQSLPVTIYGLGLREGALIYCLSKYSFNSEVGVSIGVILFILSMTPGLIFGVISLFSFTKSVRNQ